MHKLKTTELNAFLIRGESRETPFLSLTLQCHHYIVKRGWYEENENRGC